MPIACWLTQSLPNTIRRRCLSIFYSTITWLGVLQTATEASKAVIQMLKQYFGSWAQVIVQDVAQVYSDAEHLGGAVHERDNSSVIVGLQIFASMLYHFPKLIMPCIQHIVPTVWNALAHCLGIYAHAIVYGDGVDESRCVQSEDGDIYSFERMVLMLLEFFHAAHPQKPLLGVFRGMLPPCCYLLLGYAQVSSQSSLLLLL
jgi:hypothetical protein